MQAGGSLFPSLGVNPAAVGEASLLDDIGGTTGRARTANTDARWGRSLRAFARRTVWTLPAAAGCLALAGMWGWPSAVADPDGKSPGTWLVVTMVGLILAVLGILAVTALLSATAARRWSVLALISVLAGTVLLAPVLGVIGLARPSVSRVAATLPAGAAQDLENRFFHGAVTRWLGLGGLALLAVGWLAFGCAIVASGVLNRMDGYLVGLAVAIAAGSAYLSWQFLTVVAAMILLAAGLGLAWTASRLIPDDALP